MPEGDYNEFLVAGLPRSPSTGLPSTSCSRRSRSPSIRDSIDHSSDLIIRDIRPAQSSLRRSRRIFNLSDSSSSNSSNQDFRTVLHSTRANSTDRISNNSNDFPNLSLASPNIPSAQIEPTPLPSKVPVKLVDYDDSSIELNGTYTISPAPALATQVPVAAPPAPAPATQVPLDNFLLLIREFQASQEVDLKFPSTLSENERRIVHELAAPNSLLSKTNGGRYKCVHVFKNVQVRAAHTARQRFSNQLIGMTSTAIVAHSNVAEVIRASAKQPAQRQKRTTATSASQEPLSKRTRM